MPFGTLRKIVTVTVALIAMIPEHTAAQPGAPRDPALLRLVYRPTGVERARVREGVPFDTVEGRVLRADVYSPPSARSARRLPAIVFVSGAENVRNWGIFRDYGRAATTHGFVAIIPDKRYPRGTEGTATGTEDTRSVIEWLSQRGQELNVDPKRLCIWTFSAGGRLTSVAYDRNVPVSCAINFYGILDLTPEYAAIADSTERSGALQRYSPAHAIAAPDAARRPTLVVRAGRDGAGLNASIAAFMTAAFRVNAPLTVLNLPEAEHAFDAVNDNDASREAVTAAFLFARRHTR